jgi:hypothetical protein
LKVLGLQGNNDISETISSNFHYFIRSSFENLDFSFLKIWNYVMPRTINGYGSVIFIKKMFSLSYPCQIHNAIIYNSSSKYLCYSGL